MDHEVCFRPVGGRVRVPTGSTLLDAVRRSGLPLAHGCRGDGLCGRCGLWILEGREVLTREQAAEARAKRANRVDRDVRLACQARVRGDVVVAASYW